MRYVLFVRNVLFVIRKGAKKLVFFRTRPLSSNPSHFKGKVDFFLLFYKFLFILFELFEAILLVDNTENVFYKKGFSGHAEYFYILSEFVFFTWRGGGSTPALVG